MVNKNVEHQFVRLVLGEGNETLVAVAEFRFQSGHPLKEIEYRKQIHTIRGQRTRKTTRWAVVLSGSTAIYIITLYF